MPDHTYTGKKDFGGDDLAQVSTSLQTHHPEGHGYRAGSPEDYPQSAGTFRPGQTSVFRRVHFVYDIQSTDTVGQTRSGIPWGPVRVRRSEAEHLKNDRGL